MLNKNGISECTFKGLYLPLKAFFESCSLEFLKLCLAFRLKKGSLYKKISTGFLNIAVLFVLRQSETFTYEILLHFFNKKLHKVSTYDCCNIL